MTAEGQPVLIVVAGPNGSGKTTVTRELLSHRWLDGVAVINPDEIAQHTFGDWNSQEAVLQAAQAAKAEREEALACRRSIAFETVFSAPDKPEYVWRALDAGFFVRFFFVCTDSPTINAARVAKRVMEGGHKVEIGKIIDRYAKSVANAAAILPFVDRGYVYDNSVDGRSAELLFRSVEGKLAKTYPAHPREWAGPMFEAIASEAQLSMPPHPQGRRTP